MQRHNMNKKIVTLILVILVSFSFLSIVMADNVTNNDTNTTDHDKIDNDKDVDNNKQVDKKTDDKKTTDKSKTNDKSNKNYIKAKGSGNEITFSDGFKGFRLDYSKSPASTGDEFKHAPTSKVSNSNSDTVINNTGENTYIKIGEYGGSGTETPSLNVTDASLATMAAADGFSNTATYNGTDAAENIFVTATKDGIPAEVTTITLYSSRSVSLTSVSVETLSSTDNIFFILYLPPILK